MIELKLTDQSETLVLPELEVALSETNSEIGGDIQTLDGNVSTYHIAHKRTWSHTWAYMSEADFNALKGFYDRQFVDFTYPLLDIDYYGISQVPVRMTLDPKQIIDNCGEVRNVSISLRETAQLGGS